jgi:hypothetical protein
MLVGGYKREFGDEPPVSFNERDGEYTAKSLEENSIVHARSCFVETDIPFQRLRKQQRCAPGHPTVSVSAQLHKTQPLSRRTRHTEES